MGHKGAPGASIYTASKHAVEGLTKAAALEGAAFGVRVNAVAPGPVETEMLNRFTGSADRKAGLVAGVPLKRAGDTGGDREGDRVSCVGQCVVRHRPDRFGRRRQIRPVSKHGVSRFGLSRRGISVGQ